MNVIIGTRGSKLALAQAEYVKNRLQKHYPQNSYELKIISTKGDREQKKALDQIGDKGLFVREIEQELLDGTISLAVHSMKDMPAEQPSGLVFAHAWKREDPRDVLILREAVSLEKLPQHAVIGTGSRRRAFQLLQLRKDLRITGIRGNVDTRIKKMQEEQLDGIVLAAAGLHRLGRTSLITQWNHEGLYPKPGFVEKIRELCTKYNIVMCMDEVITGFRVNIGGAQTVLGVTPDLCTMGKAISNGIPVSCVGGKKEIMDCIRGNKVLVPGTYPGYGLGMAAVLATLDELTKDDCAVYKQVFKVQEKIMDGLVEISRKYDIPLTITEANGVFDTLFGIPGGRRRLYTDGELVGFDKNIVNNFQRYMQENGVFLMFGGRWYVNASHTMEDAEKTLAAADKAMKALKENNYNYIAK